MQTRLLMQLISPIYEFLASPAFQHAVNSPDHFIHFVGLNENSPTASSDDAISNRKKIFYYTNLYYGILKCIGDQETASTNPSDQHHNQAVAFRPECFDALLSLLKCFNVVHSSDLRGQVNWHLLAMTDSAKATALGKEGASHKEDTTEPDKALMFFFNTYETLAQLIGLLLVKYRGELLFAPLNETRLALSRKLGDAMFTCFSELPNFRVRAVVRYMLRACLVNKIERSAVETSMCVCHTNEMLLEYFFPSVFARISETNRVLAVNSGQSNQGEAEGILLFSKYWTGRGELMLKIKNSLFCKCTLKLYEKINWNWSFIEMSSEKPRIYYEYFEFGSGIFWVHKTQVPKFDREYQTF